MVRSEMLYSSIWLEVWCGLWLRVLHCMINTEICKLRECKTCRMSMLRVYDAQRAPTKVIVEGDAGVGKCTLLSNTLLHANETVRFVIDPLFYWWLHLQQEYTHTGGAVSTGDGVCVWPPKKITIIPTPGPDALTFQIRNNLFNKFTLNFTLFISFHFNFKA